jgi:lipopolysaccharide export system permease protein
MSTNTTQSPDLRTVRLTSTADIPKDFKVHTDVNRWNPFKHIPILNWYIMAEIIGPFLVALAFFTIIYMSMALQKMVGLFVGKGVDFFRLLDYFGYLLGNTLPSTIPMACLMSGIMAAGRLSGDSEITAMRSAGVSFSRIYANFLIFGFISALFVGYLNFYLAPENTRKMNEFNNWIAAYNPMLAVTPGQFSGDQTQELFQKKGRTLYTEGLNRETGELSGIQIREWEIYMEGNEFIQHNNITIPMGGSRVTQIISAKTGNIIEKKNSKGEFEKSVRLRDGFVLEWNEKKDGFVVTDFMGGEMDYNIPTEKEKMVIGFNIKPETFSFPLLIKIRNSIQSEGLEEIPGLEILKEMNISIKGVDGLNQLVEKMKMDIILDSQKGTVSSSEMSNRYAVFTQLQGLLKDTKKTLIAFNIEIHRRLAMPVSCQIFFFLSFPLGLVVKRSGKGMSFTLAIVFLFIYNAFFILGNGISYKSNVPDWIGPWSANIVIACISVYIMAARTDISFRDSFIGKMFFWIWKRLGPKVEKVSAKLSPHWIRVKAILAPITNPIGRFFYFLFSKAKIPFVFLFQSILKLKDRFKRK